MSHHKSHYKSHYPSHDSSHRSSTRALRSIAPARCAFARGAIALVALLLASTIALACHDATAPSPSPRLDPASALAIPGDSGAPEAIFLPPLGPRKRPHGVLDTTLAPSVTICRLAADVCADTLEHFSSDSTLPDSLRVSLAPQAYVARWRTAALAPDTSIAYRATITLGDTTVGAIDIKMAPDGFIPSASDTARYAFITPRNVTPVRFQIFVPADTLYVVTDAGVHGTLAPGAITVRHGDNIPYRFQVDSGFTNLLVSIDDQLVPAGGRIRMTGSHVLVASADRRPGVALADQPILNAALTLARSPSAAAAQHLLDRIDEVEDTTDLDERLRQVEYTVIMRQGTSALSAVDAALDGHVLHAGDGTGDGEAGTGNTNPPGTALARLTPRAPSLVAKPSLLAPSRDVVTSGQLILAEPMTIGFVNGVLTTPFGALFAANALARVARATTWGTPVPFDVRLIYNHTGSGRNVAEDCTRDIAAISWALGRNSIVQRLASCLGETAEEIAGSLADFAEAGGQLASILANSTALRPADADSVATITTRWRDAGRHVLLVGHSQGNLMIQQGVAQLTSTGRYHPAADSTCIGALSLAAPTSSNWPISTRHLAGLVVENDAILLLGQNHFPQIHTELDDSAAADILATMRSHAPAIAGASVLSWRVRLHSLVDSYLRREPIRIEVQHALAHVYHSCALGAIDVTPAAVHLRPGESATLHATLTDMNGDPLDGTRGLAWSAGAGISWQLSASVSSNGTVVGNWVGGTSARATTRSRATDVGITVDPLQIVPHIKETLSGYWSPIFGMSTPPADIDINAPPPTYATIPAGWGGCGSRQQFVIEGWTELLSHTCVAHYDVTTDPVVNATQYQATFFAQGQHAPFGTVTRAAGSLWIESKGPLASLDDLPPPPLVDRVTVVALDAGGHLLATGVACAHGCSGWPDGQ